MPDYAPCPLSFRGPLQFSAAYVKTEVDSTGARSAKLYWNHATGGWEAGERDDAKHLLPLQRLNADADDPENQVQELWVDRRVMGSINATTLVFTLDSDGKPTAVGDPLGRNYVYIVSGLES